MRIFFNKEVTELDGKASLFSVLESKGLHSRKGVAVAVNNEVISKSSWEIFNLKEADQVTVITATQGG